MRRRLPILALATAYVVSLLLIGFWPTHVDEGVDVLDTGPGQWLLNRGLTGAEVYGLIEFSANILLFAPLGALALLATSRMTWLKAVLLAVVVSGGIEMAQAVAGPGRTAALQDVVANVTGAALGASLVVLGRLTLARWSRGAETRRGR